LWEVTITPVIQLNGHIFVEYTVIFRVQDINVESIEQFSKGDILLVYCANQ